MWQALVNDYSIDIVADALYSVKLVILTQKKIPNFNKKLIIHRNNKM